jgi:hypothetical protein
MYFNILRTKKIIVFFIIILSIVSCASKKSDPVAEEEIFEPDPQKRARAFADKGGGLFGDINKCVIVDEKHVIEFVNNSIKKIALFGNDFDANSGKVFFDLIKNRLNFLETKIDVSVYIVDGIFHVGEVSI